MFLDGSALRDHCHQRRTKMIVSGYSVSTVDRIHRMVLETVVSQGRTYSMISGVGGLWR